MQQEYTSVTFVDGNPRQPSIRVQELLRSKARSHAAYVSHPNNRWSRCRQVQGSASMGCRRRIKPEIKEAEEVESDGKGNYTTLKIKMYIPKHKGNSDPFNSTAAPITPLEYALVKWSRTMQIVTAWPSDVTMRQNMPKMLEAGRRAIGNLIDDAATIHAFLSYSCFHWYSMDQQNQSTSLDPNLITLARKHSASAIRDLQELIKAQKTSESRQGLENVRNAAVWLAASNIYSGSLGEAHLHFSAAMKLVDMMGGLKALPDAESGMIIHALIGLAMMLRTRPLIEPVEFDPGPWCKQRCASVMTDASIESGGTLLLLPSAPPSDTSRPTTASATQRSIFAEMRELLLVEEYKIKNALSKSDEAEEVFRWSHFRKLAVRARNVHYWCDLVEEKHCAVDGDSPPAGGIAGENFDTCMIHAARLFDRCIFEEYYSPKGPFPLSKGNYMQLVQGLDEVRARSLDSSISARRFDMLWISSVGAYFEDTFLQQRFAPDADPAPVTYYFATHFTQLARELEFDDFARLKKFLGEQYLYCPRLQDATLQKLFPSHDDEDRRRQK